MDIPMLLLVVMPVSAAYGGEDVTCGINYSMSLLVLQLATIIFAAQFSGRLFRRLRLPAVIGELCAGMLIGPYLLGSLPMPGFPDGLFPLSDAAMIPVSNELYGFAVIASILLLFCAGLQTDIFMLLKFSVAGLAVAIGGALISFVAGMTVTALVLRLPFLHPASLFMGVVCTATSIGIVTRVLHDTKKVESPEGVVILAAAVFDDVVGIILLSIIVGISSLPAQTCDAGFWTRTGIVAFRSILVWLGFTTAGVLSAHYLSAFLKRFKSITVVSVVALAGALLLAGIFEQAGLAMIVGAYVAGLTLSRTDMRYVIVDQLRPLQTLMVPVFFVVMGMFVNLRDITTGASLALGVAFTLAAMAAKFVGCGGSALLCGFNRFGATRIGFGMMPRSEVALIIAGIGLASGILNNSMFAATAMMAVCSALLAPPLLDLLMRNPVGGLRKPLAEVEKTTIKLDFPSSDVADFVAFKVLEYFSDEGFFVQSTTAENEIYRLNRKDISASLLNQNGTIVIETAREQVVFVKTLVYEALLNIHNAVGSMKDIPKPESMLREIGNGDLQSADVISHLIRQDCLRVALKSNDKRGIIEELLEMLARAGLVNDPDLARRDVFEREELVSTGMQWGVALPHAKTLAVSRMCVAIGLKKEGVDFRSLDGAPSRIFVMVLSPKHVSGPHIRFLAGITALLSAEAARGKLLACQTEEEMCVFFQNRKALRPNAGENSRE